MNLLLKIKSRIKRESFQPTLLGIIVNPVFIVRYGLFNAIKKVAPEIKGNVLDFGCGSKPYENLFIHADKYIGCDIEVSGHDHKDSKIDYFFDGKKLPFKNEQFDSVVSFETFEHIFNLPVILQEINRVTKSSGLLLISVPFVWSEHEIPYDFARYTSFGLTQILKEHGYQVIEYQKTTTYLLTVFQVLIAYFIENVVPKNKLCYLFQLILIFPLTVFAYALNAVFPKKYALFCSSAILAKKIN